MKPSERRPPQLWRVTSDVAALAVHALVESASTKPVIMEGLDAAVAGVRRDLGYHAASTSALEKLLIENIAVCWLRLYLSEFQFTITMNEGLTAVQASNWEKRLSIAQRRYLREIEALARVQRLLRPTASVQMNIATQGGQQINQVKP